MAAKAGVSIGVDDMVVPDSKASILETAEAGGESHSGPA